MNPTPMTADWTIYQRTRRDSKTEDDRKWSLDVRTISSLKSDLTKVPMDEFVDFYESKHNYRKYLDELYEGGLLV